MWSFFSVANVDFYLTCQRPVMPRIFIQWMFFGHNVQIPRNWFHIPKYAQHSLPACKYANCGCQGKLNASHSDLACISQNFHHLEVLYLVSCMISRTNPFLHFWSEDFEVRPSGWQVYFCSHLFPCSVRRWCFHTNWWAPWDNRSKVKQETLKQVVRHQQGEDANCVHFL